MRTQFFFKMCSSWRLGDAWATGQPQDLKRAEAFYETAGAAAYALGQFEDAEDFFKKSGRRLHEATVAYARGMTCFKLGRFSEARAFFETFCEEQRWFVGGRLATLRKCKAS